MARWSPPPPPHAAAHINTSKGSVCPIDHSGGSIWQRSVSSIFCTLLLLLLLCFFGGAEAHCKPKGLCGMPRFRGCISCGSPCGAQFG